jgi:hypothetical protein
MPGSLTAPGRPVTRDGVIGRVAFRFSDSVGTRGKTCFAAQWLAYAYPCQRFAVHLAMPRA